MLASIHPLGERARHNRWGLTVIAYVVASTAGGATLGAVLGGAGAVLVHLGRLGPTAVGVVVAALAALGVAFDLHAGSLPTVHRQVDEDWLGRYRGWVYGVGFGFQLGMGVVTIVTTATVYLTFVLALVTGSMLAGAAVGTTFGLVRALPVLGVHHVHDASTLRSWHRRFQAAGQGAARLAVVVQGGAVLAGAAVAGWGLR